MIDRNDAGREDGDTQCKMVSYSVCVCGGGGGGGREGAMGVWILYVLGSVYERRGSILFFSYR